MNPELHQSPGPPVERGCEYCEARLLIIDDDAVNILLLDDILSEAGYRQLLSTTNPFEVETICRQTPPDLILLDLMMPGMDGFAVLDRLARPDFASLSIPVIVLTADVNPQSKRQAFLRGANDFLTKPFDGTEVLLRIHNLLSMRQAHLLLQGQNAELEKRVRERTEELEKSHREVQESQAEVLVRLAHAAEYRDDDTGRHTQRVGYASALIAQQLGLLAAQVSLIRRTAPLHDIGKIAIPDSILLKPGSLTREEFEIMKTHSEIGGNLLVGGRSPVVKAAEQIARSHHERWEGNGYPHGLCGDAIPLEGRIVAVADVFDALTHERPYKTAWPVDKALEEIVHQSGRQFDAQVVEAFGAIWPRLALDSEATGMARFFPGAGEEPGVLPL
jgi:putative two-component system response regulator